MAELRIRGHVHHDRSPTFQEGVEHVTLSDVTKETLGRVVVSIEYDETLTSTPRKKDAYGHSD